MPNFVGPVGPLNAKIMIVGEAPGADEDAKGRPFVGSSGVMLDDLLRKAKINRADCYITNVVKFRPPGNKMDMYYTDKKFITPNEKLKEFFHIVQAEAQKVKPNVIVPLGRTALQAITGQYAIGSWRGSILGTTIMQNGSPFINKDTGLPFKVIPTYHPAAIMRQYSWKTVAGLDFKRIAEESKTPDIVLPQRKFIIQPDYYTVMQELRRMIDESEYVSFDIETLPPFVSCLGLSDHESRAICIPFLYKGGSYWRPDEEVEIWKLIGQLFALPKKFVAQNAMYDCAYLARYHSIWPKGGITHDTMLMQHALYPELPKGLHFLASVYTREPYYKDEGKEWKRVSDWQKFWIYNCKDASVTLEIAKVLEPEVNYYGVQNVCKHMHDLIEPLLTMTLQGILVDEVMAKELQDEYRGDVARAQAVLDKAAGYHVNANSPKQVQHLLYEVWKLPVKYKKRKDKEEGRSASADEDSINELFAQFPSPAFESILDIRGAVKLISSCQKVLDAPDGRLRCSWKIAGTKGGRLASEESQFGDGTNLQNIPVRDDPRPRKMFIADPGKVLVYSDLKQAELVYVAYDAQELALIELIESGQDAHVYLAQQMYEKTPEEIMADKALTKAEGGQGYRDKGKRGNHSGNYKIGSFEFAKKNRIPLSDAEFILTKRQQVFPMIPQWWRTIEHEIRDKRILTTSTVGAERRRVFFGRIDEHTYKDGYSWRPQTTVGDTLCIGLKRCYYKYAKWIDILLNVHDAILWQCPEDEVDVWIPLVEREMLIEHELHGRKFTIGVDHVIGKCWGGAH